MKPIPLPVRNVVFVVVNEHRNPKFQQELEGQRVFKLQGLNGSRALLRHPKIRGSVASTQILNDLMFHSEIGLFSDLTNPTQPYTLDIEMQSYPVFIINRGHVVT